MKLTIPEGATASLELVGETDEPITIGDDGVAVIRVTSNDQMIELTVTNNGETTTMLYNLTDLELEEE